MFDRALEEQIDLLLHTMKQYIPQTCAMQFTVEKHITQLMIRGFDGIIASCKEELENADEEHIKTVLKTMCQIDVDRLNTQELYESIENFISRYINPTQDDADNFFELNERNMVTMIQLQNHAQDAMRALASQANLIKKDRWFPWKKSDHCQNIQAKMGELQALIEALNARIEVDADRMIDLLVENIYMIFIFLLAMSKLVQYRMDIVDSIVLLSEIDRILFLTNPSLQGNTLKNKYLLYYHVIYELKEYRHTLMSNL